MTVTFTGSHPQSFDALAAGNPRERGVVFIDAQVSDAQRLVDGLLPGLAVQRLDADRDGVAQITEYLQRHPAQAVHLVGHGGPGMLRLGKALLNVSTLATYAPALRSWFGGLPGAPKLVIYGCRVAAGEAGTAFLAQIHALTGATVVASPQVVGNGHWPLRTYYPVAAHPGAALAFDAHTQATYPATLAITVSLIVSLSTGTEADTTVVTITATTGGIAVSGDQTVALNVSGAGLTPDDYILSNGGIITIPDGQNNGSITLTVANDALVEGTEIAFLSLSNPSAGLTLSGNTWRLNLIDDDTLAVTVAAGTNPTEGGTPGTFTLTLERPAPVGGLTVNYRLGGTATAADYTLAPGTNITALTGTTFTIAEGETTATVLVNASADASVDPNETVRLSLLAGAGYTLGGYDATNPLTAAAPVAVQDSPRSVALGDLNGDGILDMAVANFFSNTVSIRLGDGQGGFGGTTNVAVGTQPQSVALGDFNQDGNLDMAVANRGANTVSILLGNGQGGFSAATNVAVGTSPQSVVVGDFDNDGDLDLAIANNGSANVSILLGNGGGTFGPATNVAVGTLPFSMALGDFNNDGNADLVTTNAGSGDVSILLGNGNGTFSPTTPISGLPSLRAVAVGDLNNDGKADLAVRFGINVGFYLGNGLGGFSLSPEDRVLIGNTVLSMVIGDFNGDGNADIAGANLEGNTVVSYLGNGLGYFTDRTEIAVGSQPFSLAAGDLNGDGTLDFVTANNSLGGPGTASVLLNTLPSAGLTITDVPSVNLSVSATAGTEAGTTVITVTATASAAVVGDQTVSLGVSGTGITAGDYTLSNGVITLANGATTGSVTFTVVDDDLAEGTEIATLTISNPSAGIVLGTTTSRTITLTDNDTAGVIITQSGGSTTLTEGGATDSYTVVLNSQPTANVTITIGNDGQTSTVPTSLTFTATNWNLAQTVTVTAVNDLVAEGNHTGTITHTATSTDTFYNGLTIANVTAAITDNDTAGVIITQSGGSTALTEGGATDTYTVVLNSQPTANVTITIGNDGQSSTVPTSLTFTAANWNVAQTVTVTAVDDAVAEGNHTGTLTHTATSTDAFYNGLTIGSVTASITDNDTAGVIITQSGGSTTLTEGGATDTYTVVLNSQPTANVTIAIGNDGQSSTVPTSLTFTAANWNVAQTVTVTAVDDAVAEGNHSSTLTHTATSTDTFYNGIAIANVTAAITDNDTAGVTITPTDGSTVISEGGATDTYTVVLNSQPTADVTITLGNDGQASTDVASLTFTAANWNVAQTVTVSAVDDAVAEGNHSSTLTHTATSTDAFYNGLTVASLTAIITDNDTPGVIITQSGGTTTLTEGGATDTYTVVLNSQPTANVTIAIGNDGQSSTDATSLTFTAANWNVAQTVTVSAVDDAVAEGNHSSTLTHTATSADAFYNGIAIGSVTAAITDNDTAGVIITQSGGSTTLTEGSATDTYTVVLNSQPTANVTIAIGNDGQSSTAPASLTFTAANWNVAQTVTVTAVDDAVAEGNHSSTLTHTATSADTFYNGIAIDAVTAAITDNDAAGVSVVQSGGSTVISEGGATDTYTVVLTSQPTSDVLILIGNDGQASTDATSLNFTTANWNVAQTVTVSAVDDATTEGNHTGLLTHIAKSADGFYNGLAINTVTAFITDNDTPPTTGNASVTLNEDAVFVFNSGLFPFADADAGDTLQSLRITQRPALGQLFLDANRNGVQNLGEAITANQTIALADLSRLTFKPAANANGRAYASFQFQVSDGSLFSTAPGTMTLNVTPVNDAPTGTVTLSGTATQGQTLTAATPTLADADGLGRLSYQWEQSRDGTTWSPLTGATASTLRLTQAQVGQRLRAKVSYTDGGNTRETVTSAATRNVVNVNDAPTGRVTITGTATQGQTLTASNTLADVDGLGPITYQWRANGTNITGATGSTLRLTQAQVGKAITVAARYTDRLGTAETVVSTATRNVVNVNDAPTGRVTISGTATQGQTLTASNTLADIDGLGPITYQWRANGTNIAGATASTLRLTQAQVGKAITVAARYTDRLGTAEAVVSTATRNVVNVNDLPTGTVTITGTATQGQTLTASNTLADIDGLGPITYQWRANGTNIAGATSGTFRLTQAQVGKAITVAARYTDRLGTAETVVSAATRNVVNVNDAPTGTVIISGTATQGQTLTASNTLADVDGLGPITYQWRADGTNITGATGNTLALTQAQVGKAISVVARYTDGFGTPEAVASAPTAPVNRPLPTAQVTTLPNRVLSVTGNTPTLTLAFDVSREARLTSTVGFYTVLDTQGRVRDPLTGNALLPGAAGYQRAALANRVVSNLASQNGQTSSYTATVASNQLLSSFLVVGGSVAALLDSNPNNDPRMFFNYRAANGDRQDHVRLLGPNTLGFEDTFGGGDRDFNDVIVRTTLA
ncbi:hypothetical protein GFS31_40230 [Leptolyngbya sp. BL0902]|uniref:FG-GAP-like repeat-containing protein n=1 Tax=Leptolyngbya sp. BL0902 TaxID=1115757 RepID=UPI0018E8945E|nr:FG-GAP-like repeat-containing protein [Leptolyngbya sp. BL0902]QQE67310.1 hypothetical protein GFS31_40230 [Leptolyngbya sp. BL0902]